MIYEKRLMWYILFLKKRGKTCSREGVMDGKTENPWSQKK